MQVMFLDLGDETKTLGKSSEVSSVCFCPRVSGFLAVVSNSMNIKVD